MLYKCLLLGALVACCKKIGDFVVTAQRDRVQAMYALREGCRALLEALVQKEYAFPRALFWAEERSRVGVFGALAEALRERPAAEVRPLAEAAMGKLAPGADGEMREACLQYLAEAAAAETKAQLQESGSRCLARMEERLCTLEKEQRERARVIRAVSLSAGLTVVILLL